MDNHEKHVRQRYSPFSSSGVRKWVRFFGKRFRVNRKIRQDRGDKRPSHRMGRVAFRKMQFESVKKLANCKCSACSYFGDDLEDSAIPLAEVREQFSDRFKEMIEKYMKWRSHRIDQGTKSIAIRFRATPKVKAALRTNSILNTQARRMRSTLQCVYISKRFGPPEIVQV